MLIKLNEAYYRNGCYLSSPLIVNTEEIEAINEDHSGYEDFVYVHLKSGKCFRLRDKYKDVLKILENVEE